MKLWSDRFKPHKPFLELIKRRINMRYDFPLLKKDLWLEKSVEGGYEKSLKIPERKALVNGDTNEVISIVSDRYKVTLHEELIKQFDNMPQLQRNSIKLSEDGGIMFAEYEIITDRCNEPKEIKVNDMVSFYIRVFNSYNTKTSRGWELFGKRLVCSNGLVVPRRLAGVSLKHRTTFERVDINESISMYSDIIPDITDLWKKWTEIKPINKKVKSFLSNLSLSEPIEEEFEVKMLGQTKNDVSYRPLDTNQHTLWELYNIMTYYLTHKMITRGKHKMFNARQRSIEYSDKFYNFNWN